MVGYWLAAEDGDELALDILRPILDLALFTQLLQALDAERVEVVLLLLVERRRWAGRSRREDALVAGDGCRRARSTCSNSKAGAVRVSAGKHWVQECSCTHLELQHVEMDVEMKGSQDLCRNTPQKRASAVRRQQSDMCAMAVSCGACT